ncbi:MAG: hypothetical protein ACLUIQ_11645 [Dialister invisus]
MGKDGQWRKPQTTYWWYADGMPVAKHNRADRKRKTWPIWIWRVEGQRWMNNGSAAFRCIRWQRKKPGADEAMDDDPGGPCP